MESHATACRSPKALDMDKPGMSLPLWLGGNYGWIFLFFRSIWDNEKSMKRVVTMKDFPEKDKQTPSGTCFFAYSNW